MTTNNQLNTPEPFASTAGGTGVASPTAHTLPVAEGSSAFNFLGPLTNGQLLIGNTGSDPSAATLTAGTGISITNSGGSITINAIGSAMTWNTVTTGTSAAVNNGYFTNSSSLITVTLPATAAVGSIISVAGQGSGGWTLAANTGQTIQFGNVASTSGGSWSSANQYDTIQVVCQVANTTWQVLSAISAGLTKA